MPKENIFGESRSDQERKQNAREMNRAIEQRFYRDVFASLLGEFDKGNQSLNQRLG